MILEKLISYRFHPKQDTYILIKSLKNANVIDSLFHNFNHFDFAYGRQVGRVQKNILSVENQYNSRVNEAI